MKSMIKKICALSVGVAVGLTLGLVGTAAATSTSPVEHASAAAAASTPRCAISGLVIWLDTRGEGTAGATFYYVEFTNLSPNACTLSGYLRVSGINLDGRQLGSEGAPYSTAKSGEVVLASGARASMALRITDVDNFTPSACYKVTAAGLRVYAPSQSSFKVVPFPFDACSRTGPIYLHELAVQKANSLG
jgi:hypothetical protein